MMQSVVFWAAVCVVFGLPFSYFVVYAMSKAYFQSKSEYHRALFKNISKGGEEDEGS